jgi:ribosome recycling factor
MPTGSFDISELKRRMQGATQSLKHELGGLRTGRAAASMLEPVQVDAYGTHMPLNQLATISVPEPRLLSVQVWDKSMVKAVEKAIVDSNLGLSPATEGQVLRLRIPELNEDRRTSVATVSIRSRSLRRITKFPRTIRNAWPTTCRKRPTRRFRRSTICLLPRRRKSSLFRYPMFEQ